MICQLAFVWYMTSRPDPRISITRGKKLDLIADAPANIDEIKLYVDKRLDNSIFAHKGELADQKSELAHRISIAAKGQFSLCQICHGGHYTEG